MQRLVAINGTRIFVDERGTADTTALLYIHGGPGNPCWDFMESVGDRLAERLRVIGVDQRGVLRSDPLADGVDLDVDLLIDDFEALRVKLGIDRWAILGHSAGGAYALDYAIAHPDSVRSVIFDCPCWDCDATDRFRLPRVAELAESHGNLDEATFIRELAARPERLTGGDEIWKVMQAATGEAYLDLFFHDASGRAAFERVMTGTESRDLDWSRQMSHLPLLADMYVDRRPSLQNLTVPSLLVHGRDDLVIPPHVVEEYRQTTGGAVHVFEEAGHFAFIEEPDAYARVVSDFVMGAR